MSAQVEKWMQDPEFSALPPDRKRRIISNYFDSETGQDQSFIALPDERKQKIRDNFLSHYVPLQEQAQEVVQEKKPAETLTGKAVEGAKALGGFVWENAPTPWNIASGVKKVYGSIPDLPGDVLRAFTGGSLQTAEGVARTGQYGGDKLQTAAEDWAERRPEEHAKIRAKIVSRPDWSLARKQKALEALDARTAGKMERYERIGEIGKAVSEKAEIVANIQGELAQEYGGQPEHLRNKDIFDDFGGKGWIAKDPRWWWSAVAETVPSLLASIVPAGGVAKGIGVAGKAAKWSPEAVKALSRIGASVTGGAVGGALEAGPFYKEMLELATERQIKEGVKELDENRIRKEAGTAYQLQFLAVAGLNALSTDRILQNKVGEKLVQRLKEVGLAGLTEGVTEGLEEPAQVVSQILAAVMNGEEVPQNIFDMFVDSVRDAATIFPIAAITGGAANVFTGGDSDYKQRLAAMVTEGAVPPGTPPPVAGTQTEQPLTPEQQKELVRVYLMQGIEEKLTNGEILLDDLEVMVKAGAAGGTGIESFDAFAKQLQDFDLISAVLELIKSKREVTTGAEVGGETQTDALSLMSTEELLNLREEIVQGPEREDSFARVLEIDQMLADRERAEMGAGMTASEPVVETMPEPVAAPQEAVLPEPIPPEPAPEPVAPPVTPEPAPKQKTLDERIATLEETVRVDPRNETARANLERLKAERAAIEKRDEDDDTPGPPPSPAAPRPVTPKPEPQKPAPGPELSPVEQEYRDRTEADLMAEIDALVDGPGIEQAAATTVVIEPAAPATQAVVEPEPQAAVEPEQETSTQEVPGFVSKPESFSSPELQENARRELESDSYFSAEDYGAPSSVGVDALRSRFSGILRGLYADGNGPSKRMTKKDVVSVAAAVFNMTPKELQEYRDDNGAFDLKAVEEAFESAIVGTAESIIKSAPDTETAIKRLSRLYDTQPILGSRTSDSIARQAYSTPVNVGFIMQAIAGVGENTTIYEPTAGLGMLLTAANPENVTANEKDKTRASLIESIWPLSGVTIHQADGASAVGDKGPVKPKSVDVVLANPPFGKTDKQTVDGYEFTKIDHVIVANALQAMKDDGRAVLLIGGHNFGADGKMTNTNRVFLNYLHSNYNVKMNIDVAGETYARMGASFPYRIIIIQGRKATAAETLAPSTPDAPVYKKANTAEQIWDAWQKRRVKDDGERTEDSSVVAETGVGVRETAPVRGPAPDTTGSERDGQPEGGEAVREVPDGPGGETQEADRAGEGRRGQPGTSGRRPDALAGTDTTRRTVAGVVGLPERMDRSPDTHGRLDDVGRGAGKPTGLVDEGLWPTGGREAEPGGVQEGVGGDVAVLPTGGRASVEERLPIVQDEAYTKEKLPQKQKAVVAPQGPHAAEEKAMGELVKDFGKEGAKAFAESMAGIAEIFGGPHTLKSFPAGFDQEAYAKAKPHFIRALHHSIKAGDNFSEFIKRVLGSFDERIKKLVAPLIKFFVLDVKQRGFDAVAAENYFDTVTGEFVIPGESGDALQVAYTPRSKGNVKDEILTPKYMQQPIADALERIEKEVGGDIDAHVMKELGYDSKGDLFAALYADQVDAVALALDAFSRGQGMIIADQTGVGKGRVAWSITRWAKKNGYFPVFFTDKPNLFSDLYRDSVGTISKKNRKYERMNNPAIFADPEKGVVTDQEGNKIFDAQKGKPRANLIRQMKAGGSSVLANHDMALVTYSQIQNSDSAVFAGLSAMDKSKVLFVLDESHLAAGQDSTRGQRMAEMLRETPHPPIYLSATFSKRPDTLGIYFRTAIGSSGLSPEALATAFQRGGVPLQEVVSSALAKLGQVVRREKSFKGITVDTTWASEERTKDAAEKMDKATAILRSILDFDRDVSDFIGSLQGLAGDRDTKRARLFSAVRRLLLDQSDNMVVEAASSVSGTLSHPDFASVVHNAVRQTLLSLKTEFAIEEAIKYLEAGKQLIIMVSETRESLIESMVQRGTLTLGGDFDLSLADSLKGHLQRSLRLSVKTPKKKDPVFVRLNIDAFPAEIKRKFRAIENAIEEMGSDIPGSPIDEIRRRLTQAGYATGEITGRSYYMDPEDYDNPTLVRRPVDETKDRNKTMRAFNSGELRCVIINAAGASGASLHSAPEFKNREQRIVLGLQEEHDINTEIQKMGRANRRGQVNLPAYYYLRMNLPAEIRPATVLARKLKSLSANVSAKADSPLATKNEYPDIINKYGAAALRTWLDSNLQAYSYLNIDPKKEIDVLQVTGKMSLMPVKMQEQFYEEVREEYERLVEIARTDGSYDLDVTSMDTRATILEKTLLASPVEGAVLPEINNLAGPVHLEKIHWISRDKPTTNARMDEQVGNRLGDKSAQEFAQDFVKKARAEAEKYMNEKKKAGLSGEQINNLEEKNKSYLEYLDNLEQNLQPGQFFEIGLDELFPGMKIRAGEQAVLGRIIYWTRAKKPIGHPLAPSNMTIMAAFNNELQYMVVKPNVLLSATPLSDTTMGFGEPGGFGNEAAVSQLTEERYVITGNLLVGATSDMATTGTKLVRFTLKDGKIKEGYLLPRYFEPDASGAPIRISYSQAKSIVELGGAVYNDDGARLSGMRINTRNALEISVPSSSTGTYRKIVQDRDLLAIIGGSGFRSYGRNMIAEFAPGRLPEVMNILKGYGISFQASKQEYERAFGPATQTNETEILTAIGESQPRFYSKLMETVTEKIAAKRYNGPLNPVQVKQDINKWLSGNFTKVELEWSGINEWLDKKIKDGEKVTREQVLAAINPPVVEESRGEGNYEGKYTTPGVKYDKSSELLLTWQSEGASFFTPHWTGNKNVVVHVRIGIKDTPSGRLAVIEEIQSDWGSRGRKEGFRRKEDLGPINITHRDLKRGARVPLDARFFIMGREFDDLLLLAKKEGVMTADKIDNLYGIRDSILKKIRGALATASQSSPQGVYDLFNSAQVGGSGATLSRELREGIVPIEIYEDIEKEVGDFFKGLYLEQFWRKNTAVESISAELKFNFRVGNYYETTHEILGANDLGGEKTQIFIVDGEFGSGASIEKIARVATEAALSRRAHYSRDKDALPRFPWADTDHYMALGFRRAVTWAVDNGADYVAWTPPDVQKKRYPGMEDKGGFDFLYGKKIPSIAQKMLNQTGGGKVQQPAEGLIDPAPNISHVFDSESAEYKAMMEHNLGGVRDAVQSLLESKAFLGAQAYIVYEKQFLNFDVLRPIAWNKPDGVFFSFAERTGQPILYLKLAEAKKYARLYIDGIKEAKAQNSKLAEQSFKDNFDFMIRNLFDLGVNEDLAMDIDEKIDWLYVDNGMEAAIEGYGNIKITPTLREVATTKGFPLFKKGEPGQEPVGMSVVAVEDAISGIVKNIKGLPVGDIRVVNTVDELPGDLRKSVIGHQAANTEGRQPMGFFVPSTGEIYLIASRLVNATHAQRIFLHELVGHFGLRKALGNRLDPFLQDLWVAKNSEILANEKALGRKAPDTAEARLRAAEEWFASSVDKGEIKDSLWKRFVRAIKDALRAMGFKLELSDADIAGILSLANKAVFAEGKAVGFTPEPEGGLRFADGKTPDEIRNERVAKALDSVFTSAQDKLFNAVVGTPEQKRPKTDLATLKEKAAALEKDPLNMELAKDVFGSSTIETFFDRFVGPDGKFDLKRVYDNTGIELPTDNPKDMSKAFRRIQNMQYIAHNYPEMARLLEVQLSRMGESNQRSVLDSENTRVYFKLPKKKRARVNKAILEGDAESKIWSRQVLQDKYGLDESGIQGYWAIRRILEEKLDIIIGRVMVDLIGEDAAYLAGMDEGRPKNLIEAIKTRNAVFTKTQDIQAREAATDKMVETWKALRVPEEAIPRFLELAEWAWHRRAYFPHQWDTEWAVRVIAEKNGRQQSFLFPVPTIRGKIGLTRDAREKAAMRAAVQVVQSKLGWTKEQVEAANKKGELLLRRSTEMPMELFEGTNLQKISNLVETATNNMMKDYEAIEDKEFVEKVKAEILDYVDTLYRAKGWGKHLMPRIGTMGYRTDVENVLANYLTGFNAYISKADASRAFAIALKDIDPKRTNLWRTATEYVSDMLGPTTGEAGTFKKIAGAYFLMADISAALLNKTQNWTHGVGMIGSIPGSGLPEAELIKAEKDVSAHWLADVVAGRPNFSEASKYIKADEIGAMREAYIRGWLEPTQFAERTGLHANKFYLGYLSEMHRALYFLFRGSEAQNRMSTFLAAYRRAKKTGMDGVLKAKEYKDAHNMKTPVDVAIHATKEAHFLYGKPNRPEIIRKLGTIGNIGWTFMTYPIGNIFWQIRRWQLLLQGETKEDRALAAKVIARHYFYLAAIGGVTAWPFLWILAAMFKLFHDDPEDDPETLAYKYTPEEWKKLAQVAVRGIPVLAGVDMSFRAEGTNVSSGLIGFSVGETIFGRISRGKDYYNYGDYSAAFFMAMPDMLRNPYLALSNKERGGTGKDGMAPIEYTPMESFIKGAGLSVARESLVWKQNERVREEEAYYRRNLNRFAGRMYNALGDEKQKALVINQIHEYNTARKNKGGRQIGGDDLRAAVQRFAEGKLKPFGSGRSRQQRARAAELSNIYGTD